METSFEKLYHGYTLSESEAYQLLNSICREDLNATQIASVLAFYIKRPITVNELIGFRNALLDLCQPISLSKVCIDLCGTGGDHKNTFNISTLSSFVLASAGIPVAKHGNYGSSSVSGSSDILKYLGYEFKSTSDELNRQLDQYSLCFLHAPLFHPALKVVSKQRKDLRVRTFFNLLGPLVNPAKVTKRYLGVYSLDVARLYNYILQQENCDYVIVNSIDGYDEVSLTSPFRYISNSTEKTVEPYDLGFETISQMDIYGGSTIEESSKLFLNVLQNRSTKAQKDVVIINSALAMQCYNGCDLESAIGKCREALESGKTNSLFKAIIQN